MIGTHAYSITRVKNEGIQQNRSEKLRHQKDEPEKLFKEFAN